MKKEDLIKVANCLNEIGVTWAVGSSVLLSFYNLVNDPNDIDILINSEEADKIKLEMSKLGQQLDKNPRAPYSTKEFFGYKVGDTEVEFMGNFGLDLGRDGKYELILDSKAIVGAEEINCCKVNITSLEDWIVAYMVMNDPKNRVQLIKDYFETMGIEHRDLLERNLKQNIPQDIKNEIINLLDIV